MSAGIAGGEPRHSQEPGGGDHFVHEPGGGTHLAQMANDIGHFFRSDPNREDAIAGIANHIAKFWTKRMLTKLAAHVSQLGPAASGLEELPLAALQRLSAKADPVNSPPAS